MTFLPKKLAKLELHLKNYKPIKFFWPAVNLDAKSLDVEAWPLARITCSSGLRILSVDSVIVVVTPDPPNFKEMPDTCIENLFGKASPTIVLEELYIIP